MGCATTICNIALGLTSPLPMESFDSAKMCRGNLDRLVPPDLMTIFIVEHVVAWLSRTAMLRGTHKYFYGGIFARSLEHLCQAYLPSLPKLSGLGSLPATSRLGTQGALAGGTCSRSTTQGAHSGRFRTYGTEPEPRRPRGPRPPAHPPRCINCGCI